MPNFLLRLDSTELEKLVQKELEEYDKYIVEYGASRDGIYTSRKKEELASEKFLAAVDKNAEEFCSRYKKAPQTYFLSHILEDVYGFWKDCGAPYRELVKMQERAFRALLNHQKGLSHAEIPRFVSALQKGGCLDKDFKIAIYYSGPASAFKEFPISGIEENH